MPSGDQAAPHHSTQYFSSNCSPPLDRGGRVERRQPSPSPPKTPWVSAEGSGQRGGKALKPLTARAARPRAQGRALAGNRADRVDSLLNPKIRTEHNLAYL